MRVLFFFVLLFLFHSSFCQTQNHKFDKLVEKLGNKAWFLEKVCVNDTCHTYIFEDSSYYYYYYKEWDERKNRIYFTYYNLGNYVEDPVDGETRELISVCNPYIYILNATNRPNKYKTFLLGEIENCNKNGTLTFISDSEFVLKPGITNDKEYYKLIPTPKRAKEFLKSRETIDFKGEY